MARLFEIAAHVGRRCLLIGVDLKKSRDLLDAAYNDSRGLTAAFNRNLLARIYRELNAGGLRTARVLDRREQTFPPAFLCRGAKSPGRQKTDPLQ